MDGPAEQHQLFTCLLRDASRQAETMLTQPEDPVRASPLLLSPYVEDQLLAVALRLGRDAGGQPLLTALQDYFGSPASTIAIMAHRQAIWSDDDGRGLPIDLATMAVAALERRLTGTGTDPGAHLANYAALYVDLWCDPRIDAVHSARRIMLAMVSTLLSRSDALQALSGETIRSLSS